MKWYDRLPFEMIPVPVPLNDTQPYLGRVLARISKMPVQNSNSKISAHPNLATSLLLILYANYI